MERTLLLNATYEPLKVVSWQRAITLFFQGKADVVENYDRTIVSPQTSIPVPAVVRLRKLVHTHRFNKQVTFSRKTLFIRDRYTCQYCGNPFPAKDLTLDHVLPVCQGGSTTWDNLVAACKPCNYKKSGRTPAQANMGLLSVGKRPHWSPAVLVMLSLPECTPAAWRNYLYEAT